MRARDLPASLAARYEPIALLGVGSFGSVHRVRDRGLGREAALKLLLDPGDDGLRRRFAREAEALAAVSSPHVVPVYDYGEAEGRPYLVMKLVPGRSLLAPPEGLELWGLAGQLARGLAALHARGIVHRDLKPANVMLTPEGQAVILDLGLVWTSAQTPITGTGQLVGSMSYLGPEVLAGGKPSAASDWYALGVTLFILAEGRLPFAPTKLIEATKGAPLPAPRPRRADPGLARAIAALLQPDPAKRPDSPAALVAARGPAEGRTYARRLDPKAPPGPAAGSAEAPGPPGVAASRSRRVVATAAAALAVSVGGGVGAWLLRRPPAPSPTPAEPSPFDWPDWRARLRGLDAAAVVAALHRDVYGRPPAPLEVYGPHQRHPGGERYPLAMAAARAGRADPSVARGDRARLEPGHPALRFVPEFVAVRERLARHLAEELPDYPARLAVHRRLRALEAIDAYFIAWGKPGPYGARRVTDRLFPQEDLDPAGAAPVTESPPPGGLVAPGRFSLWRAEAPGGRRVSARPARAGGSGAPDPSTPPKRGRLRLAFEVGEGPRFDRVHLDLTVSNLLLPEGVRVDLGETRVTLRPPARPRTGEAAPTVLRVTLPAAALRAGPNELVLRPESPGGLNPGAGFDLHRVTLVAEGSPAG